MRAVADERLPGLAGELVRSVGCHYDLTPDRDFALGAVPGTEDRVLIAAGFSGHGFKFVPVIGEVLADLVETGATRFDLDFLSPRRFRSSEAGH
jgi:sarcosine oxidase